MNKAFTKFKRITTLLAGISIAAIPAVGQADWSIMGLGTLGGYYSQAHGINDSGWVVGDSDGSAFMTGPNGVGITDFGTLGGLGSFASGINDSGQVAGYSFTRGIAHAFITGPNGVGMTDLGTLGGRRSYASDINNSGQVVGSSNIIDSLINFNHAFITGPNGAGMTDLGTLGGRDSFASDINDSGEVVGTALTADVNDYYHAFLFSHGGMTDLSLLDVVVAAGWTDLRVSDINNNGQMVGYGVDGAGHERGFLLSYTSDTVFDPSPILIPVPEPETYTMLLAGLGLIGFMAWRRKETAA